MQPNTPAMPGRRCSPACEGQLLIQGHFGVRPSLVNVKDKKHAFTMAAVGLSGCKCCNLVVLDANLRGPPSRRDAAIITGWCKESSNALTTEFRTVKVQAAFRRSSNHGPWCSVWRVTGQIQSLFRRSLVGMKYDWKTGDSHGGCLLSFGICHQFRVRRLLLGQLSFEIGNSGLLFGNAACLAQRQLLFQGAEVDRMRLLAPGRGADDLPHDAIRRCGVKRTLSILAILSDRGMMSSPLMSTVSPNCCKRSFSCSSLQELLPAPKNSKILRMPRPVLRIAGALFCPA
jgi:hypothetical protein